MNGVNRLVDDDEPIEIPKVKSKSTIECCKKFIMTERYIKNDNSFNPTCIICINEIVKGASCLKISCGHIFHFKCVEEWLVKENKCPTCRYQIKK